MNKLILALMIAVGLTACGKSETKPVVQAKVESPKPNWSTGQNVDKMDGTVEKWAMIDSTNKISMKFPYQGGSSASIIVFDNKHVKIFISKGQVMCSNYSGCKVRIKFDDEKPSTFSAVGPDNGQSNYVFLTGGQYSDGSASRFIKKLATANKVLIEMEIYQEHWPVWEFEVSGFNSTK